MRVTRRSFMVLVGGVVLSYAFPSHPGIIRAMESDIKKIHKTKAQWKQTLTPEAFHVLREEGTERPNSSPLLHNKEKGIYACAGCDLPLFSSETKYDSGTGWPSFFASIEGRTETRTDFKLIWPRTEYHCIRCEGHQGHVFDDGPPPTFKRWCNNGVALKFVPAS